MSDSWDCPCATRNAASFTRCRRCGAPSPRIPDAWTRIQTNTSPRRDLWRAIPFVLCLFLLLCLAVCGITAVGTAARVADQQATIERLERLPPQSPPMPADLLRRVRGL